MNTEEWVALAKELRTLHQERDYDYWKLWNIYHGNYYENVRRDVMDGAGRVMLRDTRHRQQKQRHAIVANLLKGVVDDYVSLVGVLPDLKVPVPPDMQSFGDKMEHYHYGVYHASKMLMQLKAVGWWHSVMGGAGGLVWPDFKRKHATIRFVAPYSFYGVPDMEEPFALSKAIIIQKMDYLAVREKYPQVEKYAQKMRENGYLGEQYYSYRGQRRAIEVMKCLDKKEVVTIIGDNEVARAEHGLDRCPAVAMQNILIPGELRGHSDIEQAVGLNEHVNFVLNAYEEYMLQDIYAPLVVIDPQKSPEDIDPLNPNEVIPVAAGGDVKRLQPGNGVNIVNADLARTQALIEHNTGDPKVRLEGRMASSITTGRGIEKAQAPHFSRIEYRHDIVGYYLEQLNEIHTTMTYNLFGGDEFTLYGSDRNRATFYTKMRGSDTEDYGFTKVLYSPSMHMGLSERAVFVLQLISGDYPLIDDRTAIEFLGISDHPEEMLKRIEDMVQRRMKQMQAMETALAAPPPGAGGAPQSVLRDAASLEGGGAPPSTPPPGAGGAGSPPPPAAPSAVGGGEEAPMFEGLDLGNPPEGTLPATLPSGLGGAESDVQRITQIVSTLDVDKSVWVYQEGERITVICESFIDARKIKRAIRKFFPKVTVRAGKPPAGATQIAMGGGDAEGTEEIIPGLA